MQYRECVIKSKIQLSFHFEVNIYRAPLANHEKNLRLWISKYTTFLLVAQDYAIALLVNIIPISNFDTTHSK